MITSNVELSQKIKFKTDTETAKAIQPMVREKDGITFANAVMHASPFDRSKSGHITRMKKAKNSNKKKGTNATNIPSLHQESQYSLLPIVDKIEEMELEEKRKKLELINKKLKRETDKTKRRRVPLPVVRSFNSNQDLRNTNSFRNTLKKKDKGEVTYY